MSTRRPTNQTGRAGEYFVAAELNRRGYDSVTFTNNLPEIDVIALTARRKALYIQVKTQRNRGGWQLDVQERLRKPTRNMFWVLVLLREGETPRYWIIPDKEMRDIIQGEHDSRPHQFDPIKPGGYHLRLPLKAVAKWEGGWCRLG